MSENEKQEASSPESTGTPAQSLEEGRASLIGSFLEMCARCWSLPWPEPEIKLQYRKALAGIRDISHLVAALEFTFENHTYGNRFPMPAEILDNNQQLASRRQAKAGALPFTRTEADDLVKEIKMSASPLGEPVHCELCRDGGFVLVYYASATRRPSFEHGNYGQVDTWNRENWPNRDKTRPVHYNSVFLMASPPGPDYMGFTVRCNCRAAQMIGAGYESIQKYLVPLLVPKPKENEDGSGEV